MSVLKRLSQTRLYQGWMAIAGRFGGIQTVVLLAFFYFFLMGPISAFSRLSGADYLDKRQLDRGRTAWRDAESSPPDLERAKLQT
ncbi:MAG TPA: hypothetical protein VMW19_06870 [Myxococcota bacterium]|nr:hypothetical protein [Myxococcota bacterium]